jgi:hypothetical protein
MRSKTEILTELRRMLNDLFASRATGAGYPRFTRNQGFVDGYMRALLDSGQVTQGEMLEIVSAERASVSGPATRDIAMDNATEFAA